jgi:hypothetical protein
MKNRFFLFLFFIKISIFGQITIDGIVTEKNGALDGAAVYFNNTMLGTTTDSEGKFSIKVREGIYDLVVSYLGYKKIIYSLNTSKYKKSLVFKLEEEQNTLDEVIISKTVYNDEWKYNLEVFKREFIGRTVIAAGCKMLNPEVLHFNFDAKNNVLTAIARKPLEIKHESLGYKIMYELEDFTINKNMVSNLGYSRYENLKGSKRKQLQWKKNRLATYNGSYTHFYQTLLKNTTYKEGFIIHQFKRELNPERPSESAIQKARNLIRNSGNLIDFSKKIETPITAIDSAILVLKKVNLPEYIDYLYKSSVPSDSIISKKNGIIYLDFKNNLSVVYTKEMEEKGYILRNSFSKMRTPLAQTSSIIPLKIPIILDRNGFLESPLDVFYEGYWSYEKFGNSLPMDYEPLE